MLSNLRKWGLWQDSRSVIAFLLTVDLATMIAVSAALATGTADLSAFRRALILIALAMLFEEPRGLSTGSGFGSPRAFTLT
jgi:hypothetical protein